MNDIHADAMYALKLQVAGSLAEPSVLQLLKDSEISSNCYAYKIRTKTQSKLLEKLDLKRAITSSYSLNSITDVIGIRLVALFKHDMVDLLDKILRAISHSNGLSPNPFKKNTVKEIIIFSGTNAFDNLIPQLVKVSNEHFPTLKVLVNPSPEGYSSIHIVAYLNACVADTQTSIPIEIQIRTVFEDAWGEIDHKYGYVIRTGRVSSNPVNNAGSILDHLKILKRFSDACAEYADLIRHEAVGSNRKIIAPRRVVSVISDEFLIKKFHESKLSENLIVDYKQARDLKDSMKFIEAAEQFRLLSDVVYPAIKSEKALHNDSLFFYYTKMNEAICLMSTNLEDHLISASQIYEHLEELYPNFPLIIMRQAQALGKLGYLDEAISMFEECGSMIDKIACNYIGKPESDWPENLPFTDYNHMVKTRPKLEGYTLWCKTRLLDINDHQGKVNFYTQAYEVTALALEYVKSSPNEVISLNNNLLYYLIAILSRAEVESISLTLDPDTLRKLILQHVSEIEILQPDINELQVSTADTLMKAYWLLNRKGDAIKLASLVVDKCLNSKADELNDQEKLSLVRIANGVSKNLDFGVIN